MKQFLFVSIFLTAPVWAQNMPGMQHEMGNMPGMEHEASNPAADLLMAEASGTSMNPRSWPMPMLMLRRGEWNFMVMASAFVVDTQETGPRGHDKFYAPNWFMVNAEHAIGKGAFLVQFMGSLDPATITGRRYPELFQTGETAYGKPLVDAQHPHDLFMGLGVQYAYPVAEHTILQVYFAPVGDPALGPVAFPHRASAGEIPQATLSHHWQDSTHIANEVTTVALTHKKVRLEASGFYGREPDEYRWNIDHGPIDSWSARFSVFPAANWMGQFSMGRIARPEVTSPGDVVRTTASVHYSRPMGADAWSTSLVWGRNHDTFQHRDSDSFLLESVLPLAGKNFITGRFESVAKDELLPLAAFESQPAFRIEAYTVGYTRDIAMFYNVETGLGANFTAYTFPAALKSSYGGHPLGVNVYLRVRLHPPGHHHG